MASATLALPEMGEDTIKRQASARRSPRKRGAACGRVLAAFALLALASHCASVQPVGPPHGSASHAFADPQTTRLGRAFAADVKTHPGLSGLELVTSGRDAFEGRYAFAAMAEKTIDAQYYLWTGDGSGRRLMRALLEAADRGVRVRLVLDDLGLEGKDAGLAAINAHPNVEVRLFNPFAFRSGHVGDFLFDFARVNHRMHDKALIVDNAVAVVGGRNISDHYFSVDGESNFRDVDLFAAGPIVREVSETFDAFWNSQWSTSIKDLADQPPDAEALHALRARLDQHIAEDTKFPFPTAFTGPELDALTREVRAHMVWGKARVLADRPDKPKTSEPGVIEALHAKIGDTLHSELLLESAYFVPAGNGTKRLCGYVARGVKVRILTNSLASNDEAPVYAGYVRHRDDLLRCGVELHELRPDARFVRHEWTWLKSRSEAELHTKAAVYDRRQVLIGSFNMDPRSARLNTELAILVDSPPLAQKVAEFIEAGMSLSNAYRVELNDDGDVRWVAGAPDALLEFSSAPGASLWRTLETDLLSLLPIEELL